MPTDNIIHHSDACQSGHIPDQGREDLLNHRYRTILNSIPSGYVYCRVLYEQGRPVDLIHEEVNVSWEKLTGIKDATGRTLTEIFPGIAESHPEFFGRLLKVAETGITDHFEYYIDVLGKWFDNNVFSPEKGIVVSIIEDISQRKLAEEALRQSEERFRSLFEEHSSIMFIYDAAGDIVDANKAAANFYGWSIDELRRMNIRQINTLSPEAIQREMEKWGALKQKQVLFFHRRADGSVRHVELFAKKIRIKDRDLISAIIYDVTEQKQYEQVNAFRLGILQMADSHSIEELLTATLDEAEKITESLIGFFFFVAEDQHTMRLQAVSPKTLAHICKAEEDDQHYPQEKTCVWGDAVRFQKPVIHNDYSELEHCKGMLKSHLEIKRELVIPVNRDGKIVAIIGVGNKKSEYVDKDIEWLEIITNHVWDIVAKKNAEQENKKLVAQLQQASKMEMIGQLAAGIAHEINNPLNFITINEQNQLSDFNDLREMVDEYRAILDKYIAANADVEEVGRLRKKEKELDIEYLLESIPKTLEMTQHGVERIKAITRSMRNYTFKNEKGGLIPSDINKAVNESLLIAKSVYRDVATIDLHLEELPPVLCNLPMIGQVLLNLIFNSAQAIKSQNRNSLGHIAIKTWRTDEALFCSVSDDGPGMSEEVRSRIFEPFFTTKDVGQGTGLGLSISYDIMVNKHQGSISAECKTDGGTVFTLSLPLERTS